MSFLEHLKEKKISHLLFSPKRVPASLGFSSFNLFSDCFIRKSFPNLFQDKHLGVFTRKHSLRGVLLKFLSISFLDQSDYLISALSNR